MELRQETTILANTSATDLLTAFMTTSINGGNNLAAIAVLGQVSFLPVAPYDVFFSLLVEDDNIDMVHTSRQFLMRSFASQGKVLGPFPMRCLLACMIAMLSWWLIEKSDVVRGLLNEIIFMLLTILAHINVSPDVIGERPRRENGKG